MVLLSDVLQVKALGDVEQPGLVGPGLGVNGCGASRPRTLTHTGQDLVFDLGSKGRVCHTPGVYELPSI